MRGGRSLCFFVALVALAGTTSLAGEETPAGEERILQAAGLGTDGPALARFFRRRAQPDAGREKIEALIQQLGQGTSEARDKACGELVALGTTAVPFLRQAVKDPDDREAMMRARRCLEAIENTSMPIAAIRLLAQRSPEQAAEILLAYLPFADDDTVVEEAEAALSQVGLHGDRPDPSLLAALQDKVPLRRSAAAVALCQAGGGEWYWQPAAIGTRDQIHKLLQDPKPTVRLRVTLALGALKDQAAIPVLITLLGELPYAQAKLAEDFLLDLAGESAPGVPLGNDDGSRQRCSAAWTGWWQGIDVHALVDGLRKRTLSDRDRDRIQALIRQLGDDAFAVREKASADLVALGSGAVPLLQQTIKSPNAETEILSRARECLRILETKKDGIVPATAARLIAWRKPGGAAEVLLGYLPFAEDDAAAEAVQDALNAVAVRDGKIEPVLLQALNDTQSIKRAAAAEAICRVRTGEQQAVHKLLHDRDPVVRLRVARALAAIQDRDAIPVLIALLTELPAAQAWQAMEVLLPLAGERAPGQELGSNETSRRRCREAWSDWWRANGATADLSRINAPRRTLGYTLLLDMDFTNNNNMGRLLEVGPDGKPRWQFGNLSFPMDAQILPGNRVLVAEYHGMRVTERDFKGDILWRKQVAMPINCQRLPNGNTFIATRDQLLEVDRRDKELYTIRRPAHDVMAACKLRNGQIVLLTRAGLCLRLDTTGRELKSFMAGPGQYGCLDVLPNGRILIAQPSNNRVVEHDADGKIVWEATVPWPNSATRLANGHTLVASQNTQRVVELDRTGKTVWELKTEARPWRARRR